MFGTTAYHAIWEKMCAEIFDNKLHMTLRQLNLMRQQNVEQKIDYTVDGMLIEVIKRPVWERKEDDISIKAKETLIL